MEALSSATVMLLLANCHEIPQMPQFHSIPPRYWNHQNKLLDASIGFLHTRRQASSITGAEYVIDGATIPTIV